MNDDIAQELELLHAMYPVELTAEPDGAGGASLTMTIAPPSADAGGTASAQLDLALVLLPSYPSAPAVPRVLRSRGVDADACARLARELRAHAKELVDMPACFQLFERARELLAQAQHGQCSICLDSYDANSCIRSSQCFHAFHASCLSRWVSIRHQERQRAEEQGEHSVPRASLVRGLATQLAHKEAAVLEAEQGVATAQSMVLRAQALQAEAQEALHPPLVQMARAEEKRARAAVASHTAQRLRLLKERSRLQEQLDRERDALTAELAALAPGHLCPVCREPLPEAEVAAAEAAAAEAGDWGREPPPSSTSSWVQLEGEELRALRLRQAEMQRVRERQQLRGALVDVDSGTVVLSALVEAAAAEAAAVEAAAAEAAAAEAEAAAQAAAATPAAATPAAATPAAAADASSPVTCGGARAGSQGEPGTPARAAQGRQRGRRRRAPKDPSASTPAPALEAATGSK